MTTRRAPLADPPAEEAPTSTTSSLPLLDRAAILAAPDLPSDYLDVPEWGGRIKLRAMNGYERDAYDAESWRQRQVAAAPAGTAPAAKDDESGEEIVVGSLGGFRVRMVARCIIDESGRRVFSDADIRLLGQKNGAVIDRIHDVVGELSELGEGAVRKATRDLKADPSDSSG